MATKTICITDLNRGGLFFYKVEISDQQDIYEVVANLMILKNHKESECDWANLEIKDIVDNTETIISTEQLNQVI